jgi:hypothetical protein
MTTIDRTAATDAEFQARIARFGIFEEEERVERVARAIHHEQNRGASWHLAARYIRDEYLRLARAALAVIDADAERRGREQGDALRARELLAEALGALDTVTVWSGAMAAAHGGIGVRDYAEQTAASIRAALDPQTGGQR